MTRASIITSLVFAALCSGCATPETADPGQYARLQIEPQPEMRTVELTGSRLRMHIDLNDPSPGVHSPTDVIYGGDIYALPWVNTGGR
jgi:hypothetical protein